MSDITCDDSQWPLALVRLSGLPSSEQFENYLAQRLAWLHRPERHVLIYDARQARLITTEMRQRQAEWLHEHEALRNEKLLGSAVITTSPFLRLTINLLRGLRRNQAHRCVVATLPPAMLWAADRLHEAGYLELAGRLRLDFEPSAHSG